MLRTTLAIFFAAIFVAGCGSGSISSPSGASSPVASSSPPTSSSPSTSSGLAANYTTTVWADNFSSDSGGAPNSTLWAAETGNGTEYGNPGWGNNEAEYYLPSNATVSGGYLNLHGHADSSVINQQCSLSYNTCLFSSAKVSSVKTIDLSKPGFLEIKASLPTGIGSWPAIWLLPGQTLGSAFPPSSAQLATQPLWPIGGEIDIAEWTGTYFAGQDNLVQSTLHLPSGTPNPAYTDSYEYQKTTLSNSISANFHLYQLAWTPGQIEFALDNQVVMTCTKATMTCTPTAPGSPSFPASAIWPFGTTYSDYHLIMNLAIGGNLGAPSQNNNNVPSTYDQTMQIAEVRYMTP